jgi:hypothetical protein
MMFYFYIPEGTCFAVFADSRSRFFQENKNKTSYTPEDGHIGRNM